MFYRLLGKIFFILWVAPAISTLVREILYPALKDGFTRAIVKENEERRKRPRRDYTSERVNAE